LRAEANYVETIRAGEKEKATLNDKVEKIQSDLNSSGKQVRCTSIYVPFEHLMGESIQRSPPIIFPSEKY